MEGGRNSFTFYRSYWESINNLPQKNQMELYKAIIEYSLDRAEPKLTGVSKTIWILVKPVIDSGYIKYQNGSKTKANEKQNESETKAKQKQNESDALIDRDIDIDIDVDKDVDIDKYNKKEEKVELFEYDWLNEKK